jgi:SSS family solute:Na+ symporter
MTSWAVVSVILVYFGLTSIVGIVMGRRARGGDEWAVAGGRLGFWLLTFGIVATRIGGVSTYGVAGDVITGGVWNLWYAVGAVAAMATMGQFFARPYRRLGLRTVGELFQRRYRSRRCQTIASLCVQTEFLVVNIIEPYVIAQILTTVTGMPFGVAVGCAALWLIAYTTFGGLWASAATNVIHSVAIIAGLAAVAGAGLLHVGGWSQVASAVDATLTQAGLDPATWWHPAGAGWVAVVGMMLAAVMHTPAVSIWVNFSAAARDEKSVVPAFLAGGLLAAGGSLLAGLIGIETLAAYGAGAQVSSYQALTQLAIDLNPWIGGIAIAAVLAAVVSSGCPVLLASATMFVRDWVPASTNCSDDRRLMAYRVTTVCYGLLAAIVAWLGPIRSVLDLLLFAFAMVVPPAIAVTYVLYWRRTTEAGVFWGIVSGYAGGLLWYGLLHGAGGLGLQAADDMDPWQRLVYVLLVDRGGTDPVYAATLIPIAVIPLVSLLAPSEDNTAADFYRALRSTQPFRSGGESR